MPPARNLMQLSLKVLVQRSIAMLSAAGELSDHPLPSISIACAGDLRPGSREEFFLLEFDRLPGRVTEDAGEAAGPAGGRVDACGAVADAEDVRELDVPVEEAVLAGETLDQRLGRRRFQRSAARAKPVDDRLCDRYR